MKFSHDNASLCFKRQCDPELVTMLLSCLLIVHILFKIANKQLTEVPISCLLCEDRDNIRNIHQTNCIISHDIYIRLMLNNNRIPYPLHRYIIMRSNVVIVAGISKTNYRALPPNIMVFIGY